MEGGEEAGDLQPGLYDTVLSQALADQLSGLDVQQLRARLAGIEPTELPPPS